MWQRLLAARFQFAVHREQRVVAKFDLVVGKDGPKFQSVSDAPPPNELPPGPNKTDRDGFPILIKPGMIGMNGHLRLYDPKMTMAQLAHTISGQLSRPVDDRTELAGEYNIRLFWAAESSPDGPTLSNALADQLGLRLQATRGPVEFVVVDHMEKTPVDN